MVADEAIFSLGFHFGDDYSFHGLIPVHSLEVTGGAGGAIKFPLHVKDSDSVILEKLKQASALKNIILYVSLRIARDRPDRVGRDVAIVETIYRQLHKDSTLPSNTVGLFRIRAGTWIERDVFKKAIELRGQMSFKQSPYIVGQNPKLLKVEIILQSPEVGWV